jgi:hypothetical protein
MGHDANTPKKDLPDKKKKGGWYHYSPGEVPDEFDRGAFSAEDLHVPMSHWGKDHWSTLGYVEHVDRTHRGKIDNAKMRCNERLHARFAQSSVPGQSVSGRGYPTRLRDDVEIEPHDDWSCLEDMAAHGIVHLFFVENGTTSYKARAFLTEKGRVLANQLNTHKGRGKTWETFEPDQEALSGESEEVPEKVESILKS